MDMAAFIRKALAIRPPPFPIPGFRFPTGKSTHIGKSILYYGEPIDNGGGKA